jgi:hypothetical protein
MRRRRWIAAAAVMVFMSAGAAILPAVRNPLLQRLGWTLVVTDQVERADAIVLTLDVGRAGVLEAIDLVNQGVSSRVFLFFDATDPSIHEYRRRGIAVEETVDILIRDLKAAGVSEVAKMPAAVTGTEDQGPQLAEWSKAHGFTSVVVVSLPDHSRRVRRVMSRATKNHPTRVFVHAARYASFHPDSWWHTRDGVRTQIWELQKLIVDVVRHPLP